MTNDYITNCPLSDVKEMKKAERGTFDYRSTDEIKIARWNNNADVTVGSNALSVERIGQLNCWVKRKIKQNVMQLEVYHQRHGWGGFSSLNFCQI